MTNNDTKWDVIIIGGGPAGLSAALTLGRARRKVLLLDAGPPRNAAAERIHTFLTRDGTPPKEFRRIGREQLAPYETVTVREARVTAIQGQQDDFEVQLDSGTDRARRILLCTGMIDEMLPIDGFRELWGTSIFQCPYCHGWELRGRAFGILVSAPELVELAIMLRAWTPRVVALTNGELALPEETKARLSRAKVTLDERRIQRLVSQNGHLTQVDFQEGPPVALDALFARPPQRQVPIVAALGLELDPMGYIRLDERHRGSSIPGIYAAGDLTTPVQGALLAAASGMQTAAALNHGLTAALADQGVLD